MQNIEEAKFCRGCGTDLSPVSNALTGNLPQRPFYVDGKGRIKSNDPDEIWASGVKNVLGGIGFVIIAMALLFTGVAGGHAWWWAMLFPAFGMLSGGISQMAKVQRLTKKNLNGNYAQQNQFPASPMNAGLPSASANLYEIENLVRSGNKIEAIKVYRETYGAGLKEAKSAVDRIAVMQNNNQISNCN
jgi:ribosomal protein L7/L12